ncbi:MAG: hypothetical protein WCC99_13455 [Candidatus Sulfotelmatobacter sp.]
MLRSQLVFELLLLPLVLLLLDSSSTTREPANESTRRSSASLTFGTYRTAKQRSGYQAAEKLPRWLLDGRAGLRVALAAEQEAGDLTEHIVARSNCLLRRRRRRRRSLLHGRLSCGWRGRP